MNVSYRFYFGANCPFKASLKVLHNLIFWRTVPLRPVWRCLQFHFGVYCPFKASLKVFTISFLDELSIYSQFEGVYNFIFGCTVPLRPVWRCLQIHFWTNCPFTASLKVFTISFLGELSLYSQFEGVYNFIFGRTVPLQPVWRCLQFHFWANCPFKASLKFHFWVYCPFKASLTAS